MILDLKGIHLIRIFESFDILSNLPSNYRIKCIEINGIILILKVHSFWLLQKAEVWASSKALFDFAHPAVQSAL